MKIRNLTPHAINLVTEDGSPLLTIEPDGIIARVSGDIRKIDDVTVDETVVPITHTVFGAIQDLPEEEPGTILIVSSIVANAAKTIDRDDLVIPNEAVRDDKGRIVGCKSLGKI